MSALLVSWGFVRVDAEPSLFVCGTGVDQVSVLVHVDDVVMSGSDVNLQKLTDSLETEFALTKGPLLLSSGDECTMLGRTIRRTDVGYELRGDVTLISRSVGELGLTTAKHAPTPLATSSAAVAGDDEALTPELHSAYRVHVGRLLYIYPQIVLTWPTQPKR